MLPYDVFVSIGLLPQLIGVAPEKAIKLTVRIFFFFSFLPGILLFVNVHRIYFLKCVRDDHLQAF